MSRSVIAAAVTGLVVMTGCGSPSQPSAPPTSEDALTTATSTPDVVEETTEAEMTSEAPDETSEPEASEMDQTEEGAEAFVEHYLETLSAVHLEMAEVDDLRALGNDDCKTCNAFAAAADKKRFGHPYITHIESTATLLGNTARVDTLVEQVSDESRVDTVFNLSWRDERWLVSEIQLSGR